VKYHVMQKQLKMESPKRICKLNHMKTVIFLLAFLIAPFYLLAQTYQQDTATINRLLVSAKSKRFTDSSTALKEAYLALALAQKHNDGFWIYKSYHRLARIHEVNDKNQKAHAYYEKELSVEHQVSDLLRSDIYSEVATANMYVGNIRRAYEFYTKNYELGVKLNDLAVKQTTNLQLGMFYRDINEFEKATQYLMKSVEYAIEMESPDEVCDSYRMLANLYLRTKNFNLALQSSEKSISYVDKINDYVFPKYHVYTSYGLILGRCGKYEKGIAALQKAQELALKDGNKSVVGSCYFEIAGIYNSMNDLEKAEFFYEKSATFIKSLSEIEVMSFQSSYAELLLKKGKYDKIIDMLNESNVRVLKFEKKALLLKNYNTLSLAYEQKGDDSKALFFSRKSNAIKDSIFSEDNTKRIVEAEFKFDLTKSEKQVTTMKERQMTYGAGGIFLFLAFSVAFLMFYSRSKNDKNKILTSKNKEIKDKNRQLEESNEILKQFAFASAHDLKEPLRSINSFVNLIQRRYLKDAPTEAHEYMGFVTTGVKRMESLLNALLEYASVLTDDTLEKKENDLSKLLNLVLEKHQKLITEKKAIVRGPSVFPTILMGEGHLKLLLDNLVSNALKFSKMDAQIEVNYSITNTEFILSVKDEGIGLDKSYSDKIFKLFQRLDRVTHKESVGIGLTICKNIVDKYAGRIWFDSAVNEGTTFFIAFPKSMISDVPTTEGVPPDGLGTSPYFEHFAAVSSDLSAV
jgi:signal transduction histidine kinase/Tfp pilus assembly protein PilF